MLKIGKGLKKKKKNKKGKGKNDELFTEAELEQYKKEKAEKAAAEEGTPKPGASEDFEKFKLLTAGVDDILRKSQGDLDRIKKDSFFQRKPTPSELKALEEQERAEREKQEGNWIGFEEGQKPNQLQEAGEESHFEEEDSESEFEDNDDIFDTAFVDAVESGEVKLAYIPDDDELGFNDGPDPFDTTTVGELLRKAEEEERKKKKEVSLGLAVNVLTGRAERDKSLLEDSGEVGTEVKKQVRARPRKIQDFCLLGSFDSEGAQAKEAKENGESAAAVDFPKSLLDEEFVVEEDLPEGDVLITEVLVKQVARPPPPELATPPEGEGLSDLVAEFESQVDLEIKKLEEEEEFDEFSALAASAIVNQKLEEELQQFELDEDDPFDTSSANTVLHKEQDPFDSIEGKIKDPVSIPQAHPINASTTWSAFEQVPEEVDPFDTAFAEDCAPGKVELRLLEKEILGTQPINPVPKKGDIHWEARILSRNNSEDFNPRAGEEPSKAQLRQRVSIHITDPSGETQQRASESEEITAVTLSQRDLLGGSTTDLSGLADDVLPPSSTSPSQDLVIRYSDPFDTTLADQATEPGQAELRFIEKELLSDIPADTLSDEDFDPRADDDESLGPQKVSFDIPSPVLLPVVREGGGRPLTPYYAEAQSAESDLDIELEDPFDTSHVTSLPGKQELKLIEQELSTVPVQSATFQPIHEKLGIAPVGETSGLKHSVSDDNFNPRSEETLPVLQPAPRRFSDVSGLNNPPKTLSVRPSFSEDKPDLLAVEEEIPEKTLTPAAEEDISAYIDPFDTSIAENIAPGKAELKVLEVELVGSIKHSYSDQDFNPREDAVPVTAARLKTVPSTNPLIPVDLTESIDEEEIDPFDTSIATNLVPGRAELRLLESELVTQ